MDGNPLGLGRLEKGQRVPVHVGLDKGPPNLTALGLHEGVSHATADDQLVHAVEQVLQHSQLGAHLGATNDGCHRLLRPAKHLLQRLDLALHQEAERLVLREKLGDHRGGSVGAVRRAERVVDVEIAILRELTGEEFIPRLLLPVEAEVLQNGDLTGRQGLRHLQRLIAHTVGGKLDGPAEVALQGRQDVAQREVRIGTFRPPEVAHEHQASAGVQHVLQGRQSSADAGVVGHGAVAVLGGGAHRDVEVHTNQGANTREGQILKGHGLGDGM